MTTVRITIPDELAQEARSAGLLSPAKLERWLREQLEARRTDAFFAALDRMGAVEEPASMSPEDVAREIAALRAERRAKHAN